MTKPRRPLMAALRSSTRDVYTTAYVHLVLRCRGKSNNFTLGELAIVRFRLVCLSHIARITLALLRTKSSMGIEGRGKIRDLSNFSRLQELIEFRAN